MLIAATLLVLIRHKICPVSYTHLDVYKRQAPYFDGSKLLIAADCTAYAYAAFHQDFIRNKVTLIGCPKSVSYTHLDVYKRQV